MRAGRRGFLMSSRPEACFLAAARRHRSWRKKIFYPIIESRILRRARFLHVTSAEEVAEIGKLGVQRRVLELPNGVDVPGDLSEYRGQFRKQYAIGEDCPLSRGWAASTPLSDWIFWPWRLPKHDRLCRG